MATQSEPSLLEVLNVGTGEGTSVRQAIEAFERATGVKVPVEVGPRRDGDIEQIFAHCEKVERVLGWRARRTVEDAMRDAWAWQQSLGRR